MLAKAFARTFLPAVAAALMFAAGGAQAILLNGTYTVTSNGNPLTGLAVGTLNDFGSVVNSTTNSFTGLNVPNTNTAIFRDMFDIFAIESPPYTGNDLVPQPISIAFNFSNPGVRSAVFSGTTVGNAAGEGVLHWTSGPITLLFPDFTRLTITMADATFGDSFNGIVSAQFTAFVPEPGTLALLGIGLLGALSRRNRRSA